MKKSILLLSFVVLSSFVALAQVPQGINYQAVARNSSGAAISNLTDNVALEIAAPELFLATA